MKRPASSHEPVDAPLEKTTRTLTEPFRNFVNAQSASAWALMAVLLIAVGLANSTLAPMYFEFLHIEFGLSLADSSLAMSLQHWVNDGLMAQSGDVRSSGTSFSASRKGIPASLNSR